MSDFRAANQRVEKVPGVIPNQEASMAKLSEAKFCGTLDLLQGYWQCPLAPEAQEISTIATPGGFVYTYGSTARNFERHLLLSSETLTRVMRDGGDELHGFGGRCASFGFGRY